jgi:hypothetical protein
MLYLNHSILSYPVWCSFTFVHSFLRTVIWRRPHQHSIPSSHPLVPSRTVALGFVLRCSCHHNHLDLVMGLAVRGAIPRFPHMDLWRAHEQICSL